MSDLNCPGNIKGMIFRYMKGIHPGGFLHAVLSGDLFLACQLADEISAAHLYDIVKYIHNNLPGEAYGNRQNFEMWLQGEWKNHQLVKEEM